MYHNEGWGMKRPGQWDSELFHNSVSSRALWERLRGSGEVL